VSFLLKVSRPGLWFSTLWLYTLPTSRLDVWHSWAFWVGLGYVTFPLNFLIYGWNDMVDYETDRANPRKDSFLFGARGTREQLAALPPYLIASQVPFVLALLYFGGWMAALFLVGLIAAAGLYNMPRHGWRGRPPLELINQVGYLLLIPLSIRLNHTAPISAAALGYLVLFCAHSHLMGEVADAIPDAQAGRRTTALVLGVKNAKLLIMLLVLAEGLVLGFRFHDWWLGGFLLAGVVWLALDLFVLYRDRAYSRREFQLLGLGMNLAWMDGSLL
jgi:4-hydroxybenzoate polyprenyltransferase